MGYWIDEDTFQFDNEREMASSLGIDIDTMEGDYAEAFHRSRRDWDIATINREFDLKEHIDG